jgi:diacylglycerol kinase family enzyme
LLWSGVVTGVIAAVASRRVWPVAPRTAAQIRPALTPLGGEPSEDGDGLTLLVNPSAGPALRRSPHETLEEAFPKATFVDIGGDADLEEALERAASSARAIGMAGGDGSGGAAAGVAHRVGKPLVVIPAGTLNHLARDLGVHSIEDAIEAVKEGDLVAVDVALIDGQPFLNTASFGSYSHLVDARERLESSIGKWPALLVALFQVLRRYEPITVELDGRRRRLWMIFIGNCRYHPAGFAPSWRERLDDGVLDVRLVDADHPWGRVRLLLAVLTGRLGRCVVYETHVTRRLHVKVLDDGPVRLARDGEVFDGSREFEICKEDRPLAVYVKGEGRAS